MEAGGTTPAGSGRALRLDPFALPVRFPANDAGADGNTRQVEINRERVVVRRAVRGIPMKVGLSVSAFRGVALRMTQADEAQPASVAVTLDHRDEALSIPLFMAQDGDDVMAVWKAWGRVLRLPLLVSDSDGQTRAPFDGMGGVVLGQPSQRRRRRTILRRRRPTIFLRRKPGRPQAEKQIHQEREIIARN